ncbi:ATP-binding cassette domain-containing protein [Methylobacterium nodulans]|uniref:ABC transporter related n=1 Tax=Methylobacterium nodulans (strain LMG 21967 / CNCM I-2342 / ORS 2060) TaxID=460265 RepID=B8IX47_METNO|nr:ATP-binding cassette domain-containing protein [Methylobacterium nodulans]ACL63088.1 ABC transporter related [Methylobacterium nodulans ORS 2060]
MSEVLVALEGVTKRFAADAPAAIDRLTTNIVAGQVTGLVGPDGAGKTTLIRMMAALLAPSQGSITVCGHDSVAEIGPIHEVIGYMPQRFGLYEDLSVMENLSLYADLKGVVGPARRTAFDRLLAFTDLARFTDRLAGKLSGGMKQKLGLACAMLKSPRLLLLDEPGVGVDPISRRELWRMVYALVQEGVGIVWSTAYLDEAENCASVLVLNGGKVLFEGDPRAMTASMEGRVVLARGAGTTRRALLADALRSPDIIDGVLQGEAVRLVVAEGRPAPDACALGGGPTVHVEPAHPRFEDSFVAMLSGQPKRTLGVSIHERPATPATAPVEAHHLTRRFGSFTAADDISFTIRRGEIFGLLGPNGAGKSTTFKMMCGLLRPTSGTALVDGLDLYKAPAVARGRLGYMAQKFSLYGDLSVKQNLEFFAGAYGLSGRARREAVTGVIEAFDLGPYLAQNAGGLPLGYKQRLALAAAIMHEPPVLFLDEPTSGVDPLTRREFWGIINAMVGRGVTVMVTTHFMDEAEYCDRVALINRGKCIAVDTPEALQASVRSHDLPNPTLEDAFIALIEAQERESARSAA